MKTIIHWVPPTVLSPIFAFLWGASAQGGQSGVVSWLLLQVGLPIVGSFLFLTTIAAIWLKKRITWASVISALVALMTIWPYLWQMGFLPMAYPTSLDKIALAATVRLPSDSPLLVAWGGDNPMVNYHVLFPDQRWAYDLMVEPAFNGSNRLEDYGCWGVEILAPVAGEVILVIDDEPDHMPGRDSEGYSYPGGNHVFIRLETNTYLAIAHLQKGSILVKEGDWVNEGQKLGKCGNSGITSEPHIHIHHQREDPRVVPEGLAEGLPLFFKDHNGISMPEGGVSFTWDGKVLPLGPIVRHVGK